jgi:hypothetical protein
MERVSSGTEEIRDPYGLVDLPNASSMSTTICDSQPSLTPLIDDGREQHVKSNEFMPLPKTVSASSPRLPTSIRKGSSIGKIDNLRKRLAVMLPCQEDVDYLSDMSPGWWLVQRHIMPYLFEIPGHDLSNPFEVSTVSASHPTAIARLLLCVVLCIQQLPPRIDLQRLRTKVPLTKIAEKIVNFVTTTVTSDDELTRSMEGIECLILQGVYQVNSGLFQNSWLTFRRAINVAQLMGLHRLSLKTSLDATDILEEKRHYMWYQIMRGVWNNHYLSKLTLKLTRSATSLLFLEYHLLQAQHHSLSTTLLPGPHKKTSTISSSATFPG